MHRSLTGRRVRALAFVGFVASVSACTGAADEPPSATIAPTPDSTAPITATSEGEPLATPPEFVSSDGVLSATLTLERTVVDVAGESATALAVNGSWTMPTLRFAPGDTVELEARHQLCGQRLGIEGVLAQRTPPGLAWSQARAPLGR